MSAVPPWLMSLWISIILGLTLRPVRRSMAGIGI